MITKPYHPAAHVCLKSSQDLLEFFRVSLIFKRGSYEFEVACLRYEWHVARCCNCREGLDAT